MNGNKKNTDEIWLDPDDVPDLSSPEWEPIVTAAIAKRGRPVSPHKKILQTLRIDRDVIEYFKAGGPHWQTRLNNALRKIVKGEFVERSKTSRKPDEAA